MTRWTRWGILVSLLASFASLALSLRLGGLSYPAVQQQGRPLHAATGSTGVIRGLQIQNGLVQQVSFGPVRSQDMDQGGILTPGTYGDGSHGVQFTSDTAGRLTGYNAIPQVLQDKGGQSYNVLAYGADKTGATDSTSAFQAAISAAANGSIIEIPQGTYKLTGGQISLANKTLTFRGAGHWASIGNYFGDAGWPSSVKGTVLKFDASGDAIALGAQTMGTTFENFGILGPGTGTTSGININGNTGVGLATYNIGIYNFNVGINGTLSMIDMGFYFNRVAGCNTGVLSPQNANSNTTTYFYKCDIFNCTDGILVNEGDSIGIFGGTIRGMVNSAIHLAPANGASIASPVIDSVYIEQCRTAGILLDFSTVGNAGIRGGRIQNCHFSTTSFVNGHQMNDIVLFTGTNSHTNGLRIVGNDFQGVSAGLTLTSVAQNCFVGSNILANGVTDNGTNNIVFSADANNVKFPGLVTYGTSTGTIDGAAKMLINNGGFTNGRHIIQLVDNGNGANKFYVNGDGTIYSGRGQLFTDKTNGTGFKISDPNNGFVFANWDTAGQAAITAGISTAYATKTANYTLTTADSIITGDATGGAFSVTFVAASGVTAGREFIIKKTDASANAITLTPAGADTIDGAATYTLGSVNKYARVVSDGASKWLVVGNN